MNVGERFLDNAENGRFQLPRNSSKFAIQLQADFNAAALLKSFREPADRGNQAHFIEKRRVQQIRNGSEFVRYLVHDFSIFGQAGSDFGANALRLSLQGGKIHAQQGEGLAGAVVQVAGDAPSLFILDVEEPRGEFAQAAIGGLESFRLLLNLDIFFLK